MMRLLPFFLLMTHYLTNIVDKKTASTFIDMTSQTKTQRYEKSLQ
jgi:hypothetical protein